MLVRWRYALLALLTIALGLWVHRGGVALGPIARDVAGDALWAMMIAWWIGALVPRTALGIRSVSALTLCCLVELSQLVHGPTVNALRGTTLGALVLGSGFDPRDFAAYALGVATATLCEWVITRRRRVVAD